MHACIHTYIRAYSGSRATRRIWTFLYLFVCVCVCVCMCVCVYLYTYIYISRQWSRVTCKDDVYVGGGAAAGAAISIYQGNGVV